MLTKITALIVLTMGLALGSAQADIVLQPGPGANDGTDDGSATKGNDTAMYNLATGPGNGGAEVMLGIFNSPCNVGVLNGYLQFATVGMPTQGVTRAEIQVYCKVFSQGDGWPWPVSPQLSVRRVTQAWNEMTVTVGVQPTVDPAVLGTHTVPVVGGGSYGVPYTEFEGWLTFEVTSLYRGWASGATNNHGVQFHIDNAYCANGDVFAIYSSDNTNALLRPKLVVATELLANPSFEQNGASWQIAPAANSNTVFGTTGEANLHVPGYLGTFLWQDLDVPDVGGTTGTASIALNKGSVPPGNTVAVYLEYTVAGGNTNRQLLLNPANDAVALVPDSSVFSTNFTLPAEAQRLVRFVVDKTYFGQFYAQEFSLHILTGGGDTGGGTPAELGLSIVDMTEGETNAMPLLLRAGVTNPAVTVSNLMFYANGVPVGPGRLDPHGEWTFADGSHLSVMGGGGYEMVDYNSATGDMFFMNGGFTSQTNFAGMFQYFPPGGGMGGGVVNVVYSLDATGRLTATMTGDAPLGSRTLTNGICVSDLIRYGFFWENAPAGSYAITARADYDSGLATTSAPVNIVIASPLPDIFAPPQSQTNVAGQLVVFSAAANGESPLGYQWRFNGVNLTNEGRITGATDNNLFIAAAQSSDAGSYDVVVSNAHGSVTSSVATLTIICPDITLSPATLTPGTLGFSYSQEVMASGGVEPYSYAVTSGSLISGLSLATNGAVTGIPFALGTNTFTVTATDTNGCTGSQTYTLAVTGSGLEEATAPTVKIVSPTRNKTLTNAEVMLIGTAKDNAGGGVALVLLSVNGGALQRAETDDQFTNWTQNVRLVPGPNTVIAQALDFRGNAAKPVTNRYFFLVRQPFSLLTNGFGWITATASTAGTPTNGAMLIVARQYQVTAVSGSNYLFSNWLASANGGPTVVATNTAKYEFTMQTNLTLTAQFVTNRFIGATGAYNGLFWDTNNGVAYGSAGFASIKVTAKQGKPAKFSAKLVVAGETRSASGTFDLAGDAVNVRPITLKASPDTVLKLYLHLPFDGMISGVLSNLDGTWSAALSADKAQKVAAYAGQHTMILPGSLNPAASPGGDGYGLVNVSTNGFIKLVGALGDGTAIRQKVPVSENGDWPLFASVYLTTNNNAKVKGGLLMGWMSLTNGLDGTLYLIKTPVPGMRYPNGFTNEVVPLTSTYTNSALFTNRVIELTSGSDGVVMLSGGDLPLSLTTLISLSTLNKFTAPATNTTGVTNKLRLAVAVKTGKLTGSFKTNGVTATALTGAVLQNANTGHGYFKTATNSGAFRLQGQ